MSYSTETYKGWTITYDSTRPATGKWRADRYGCGVCNRDRESVLRMVDAKTDKTPDNQPIKTE